MEIQVYINLWKEAKPLWFTNFAAEATNEFISLIF